MSEQPENLNTEPPHTPRNGQILDGFFVFNALMQRVDQVAFTFNCSTEHIYHLIQADEFDQVIDIRHDTSKRPEWRIPRKDIIDSINSRRKSTL